MTIRGTVALTDASGKVQKIQAEGYKGDVRDDVEVFEQYGLTSRPRDGTDTDGPECLLIDLGQTTDLTAAVAVGDRRYRPTDLDKGAVVIYDHLGNEIRLGGSAIEITGDINHDGTQVVSESVTAGTGFKAGVSSVETGVTGTLTITDSVSGSTVILRIAGGIITSVQAIGVHNWSLLPPLA